MHVQKEEPRTAAQVCSPHSAFPSPALLPPISALLLFYFLSSQQINTKLNSVQKLLQAFSPTPDLITFSSPSIYATFNHGNYFSD